MSLVEVMRIGLLIVTVGWAAISGGALIGSIDEGDAVSAWGWGAIFTGASLIAAWYFWRVV
jgi:hypothetical protein